MLHGGTDRSNGESWNNVFRWYKQQYLAFFSIKQIIPCQQNTVIYHNFVKIPCILVHFESEGAAGKCDVWLFTTQCYWPHKRWCIMYHHHHHHHHSHSHTSSALFSSLNHPVAPAVLLEKCIIGTAHAGRAPVIVFTMDKKKTKSSGTAIFLMRVIRFVHRLQKWYKKYNSFGGILTK